MKLDRLMGILTTLLQNEIVTAPYLAQRFEVSRRTINRDIDALCKAGIPVITKQGSGGGIYIAQGFKLDKNVLTTEELASVISALKGIGTISQSSHTNNILDKFGTDAAISLRESIVIDLASHYKGSLTKKIEIIKQAVQECRTISFDYYYEKGLSHRCIEPYFVVFQWTSWYVFGFCQTRQDWRMFKLARLWNLSIDNSTYSVREIPKEKRNFSTCLPDDKKLVALFDNSERYRLIETYGLECYTEMPNGKLKLEIGYTNHDYMVSWLLAFGNKATVLEPAEMAIEIKGIAKKISENYGSIVD